MLHREAHDMACEDQRDETMMDGEGELPSHAALLLESGLYREYDLNGDFLYIKRMYEGPGLQFDAPCVYCRQTSTFRQYVSARGGGSRSPTPKDGYWLEPRVFCLEFRCQRELKHAYHYVFRVERQAITKIGQSPSLATIASFETARFRNVLQKNYRRELSSAIGLFAHGIGVGSFVYLRRIFEHLLVETAETARSAGDLPSGFESMRLLGKVRALAPHLPNEVVETAGTYGLLSAGIHELSEKQCLSLFPIMRASIEMILDAHLAARKRAEHKQELKRALTEAERQVKTTKSKTRTSAGG